MPPSILVVPNRCSSCSSIAVRTSTPKTTTGKRPWRLHTPRARQRRQNSSAGWEQRHSVMDMKLPSLEFHLPFAGRWFVLQGGDSSNVNHHMKVRAQWYGIDFMKAGGPGERALSKPAASTVEDFFSW